MYLSICTACWGTGRSAAVITGTGGTGVKLEWAQLVSELCKVPLWQRGHEGMAPSPSQRIAMIFLSSLSFKIILNTLFLHLKRNNPTAS